MKTFLNHLEISSSCALSFSFAIFSYFCFKIFEMAKEEEISENLIKVLRSLNTRKLRIKPRFQKLKKLLSRKVKIIYLYHIFFIRALTKKNKKKIKIHLCWFCSELFKDVTNISGFYNIFNPCSNLIFINYLIELVYLVNRMCCQKLLSTKIRIC